MNAKQEIITCDVRELEELLQLPAGRQHFYHWYGKSSGHTSAGCIENGGGPTPKVTITKFDFKPNSYSGYLTEKWEPHLNGDLHLILLWESITPLRLGLILPPYLQIEIRNDFAKLMWNVESQQ